MARWRIPLGDDDPQELFGNGVVVGCTVLSHVLLVLAGSIERGGSSHKLMRELGFMFALVLGGK